MSMTSPEPQEQAAADVFIVGRVQGVCYRAFTQDKAQQLGLCGCVRNLPDGRVHVEVEGPRDKIEQLLERLREGPPGAQVRDLTVTWKTPAGRTRQFMIAG